MNYKQKWLKAREQISESLASNMGLYGINHSVGRLYATLFFHHEPMTLEDMMQELGMSKTSMSTGIRILLDAHMVNKVWKRGVRKDIYEIESDWYQNFIDFFRTDWRQAMELNVDAMRKCLKIIDEAENDEEITKEDRHLMSLDREKLSEAIQYYDWLGRFVEFLESGEVFKHVPKLNGR